MIEKPLPEDILPRKFIFSTNAHALAAAMLPWAKRNPRFTLMCALEVCGLTVPDDVVRYAHLTRKVQDAIRCLGCLPDGLTRLGAKIWKLPEYTGPGDIIAPPPAHLVHNVSPDTRVTSRGLSEILSDRAPQAFQIEVARAWLREHARSRGTLQYKHTSDAYRRLVTEWTRQTKLYAECEQVNEHTKQRYRADRVYISNGAMIAAALEEGYHVRSVSNSSHDAWFNIGLSGRPAVPWVAPKVAVPAPAVVTVSPALRAFLGNVAKRKRPWFTLEESGVTPKELRAAGCSHKVMLVDRRRGSLWYRRSDQPHLVERPRQGYCPRPRPPKLVLDVGSKTRITLAEAAEALGLPVPKGRAPRQLIDALKVANFYPWRGCWLKKQL